MHNMDPLNEAALDALLQRYCGVKRADMRAVVNLLRSGAAIHPTVRQLMADMLEDPPFSGFDFLPRLAEQLEIGAELDREIKLEPKFNAAVDVVCARRGIGRTKATDCLRIWRELRKHRQIAREIGALPEQIE